MLPVRAQRHLRGERHCRHYLCERAPGAPGQDPDGGRRGQRRRFGRPFLAGRRRRSFPPARRDARSPANTHPPEHLYAAALVGLLMTGIVVLITNYYTSTAYSPVRNIAKASQTGHATNIIAGLALGQHATALPVGFHRHRHPAFLPFRRAVRHRHRGHVDALHGGHHHFAGCLRAHHGQRRRHRRHEQSAQGSARR